MAVGKLVDTSLLMDGRWASLKCRLDAVWSTNCDGAVRLMVLASDSEIELVSWSSLSTVDCGSMMLEEHVEPRDNEGASGESSCSPSSAPSSLYAVSYCSFWIGDG